MSKGTFAFHWILIELYPKELHFVNHKTLIIAITINELYSVDSLIFIDQQCPSKT